MIHPDIADTPEPPLLPLLRALRDANRTFILYTHVADQLGEHGLAADLTTLNAIATQAHAARTVIDHLITRIDADRARTIVEHEA